MLNTGRDIGSDERILESDNWESFSVELDSDDLEFYNSCFASEIGKDDDEFVIVDISGRHDAGTLKSIDVITVSCEGDEHTLEIDTGLENLIRALYDSDVFSI